MGECGEVISELIIDLSCSLGIYVLTVFNNDLTKVFHNNQMNGHYIHMITDVFIVHIPGLMSKSQIKCKKMSLT